jgi:hypothetical protein
MTVTYLDAYEKLMDFLKIFRTMVNTIPDLTNGDVVSAFVKMLLASSTRTPFASPNRLSFRCINISTIRYNSWSFTISAQASLNETKKERKEKEMSTTSDRQKRR